MKVPVVKKGNKYYNTLTDKYVSKSYAERINRYFEIHPKSNIARARGHAVYKPKRPFFEHEKEISKKLTTGKGFQVYKTKNIKGETVYYSPMYDKYLPPEIIEKIDELDYKITKNVFVELYRMSRDRERIYHLITWNVDRTFSDTRMLELWLSQAENIYKKIEKEMKEIVKKYPIGYRKLPIIYAHVSNYFYSDIGGYSHGKSFGFYDATESGFEHLHNDFIETVNWYINKLEIMSYHNIWIEKFTFYIMDFYKTGSLQETIAKFRMGINRPTF